MPTATVSVIRVYSTRVARGRVVRQRPEARTHLQNGVNVVLAISKGSPFAEVPAISVGAPAETAKGYLKRKGFRARYRFTPSWSVGKGTVIGVSPSAGTRVRRPATVRVIVSSGPPQRVIPDVQNIDLESAKQQLAARHLRYGIVYRPAHDYLPNHVVVQDPLPGTTTYEGTLVWLAVARTLRWKQVFADSGSGSYESVPFTVPAKWRIRYTLDTGFFGDATTEFAWTRDGGLFSDGSFVADTAGARQLYNVPDGAGTYRLSVMPDSRRRPGLSRWTRSSSRATPGARSGKIADWTQMGHRDYFRTVDCHGSRTATPASTHCDLFAFRVAPRRGPTVVVIDVHPSVGINPPGPTTTEPFSPDALYELKIDTNGDGVADIAFGTRCLGEQRNAVRDRSPRSG